MRSGIRVRGFLTGAIVLVFLMMLVSGPLFAENKAKNLRWVGDPETAASVMLPLVNDFEELYGIHVDLDIQTSTKGLRSVATGQAALGGSGRYMAEGMPEEMGVEMHPIAWSAVVVVVHPDNPLANLGQDDLRAILTGKVKNWSLLGGADAPITLYQYDDPLKSIEYVLPDLLFGYSDVELVEARYLEAHESLFEAIAKDPTGIGFAGLVTASQSGLKILMVDGVEPSAATLLKGDYPLFRTLYLVSSPTHQQRHEIRRFVRFAERARNRDLIREAGAVAYREAVRLVVKDMNRRRAIMQHSLQR